MKMALEVEAHLQDEGHDENIVLLKGVGDYGGRGHPATRKRRGRRGDCERDSEMDDSIRQSHRSQSRSHNRPTTIRQLAEGEEGLDMSTLVSGDKREDAKSRGRETKSRNIGGSTRSSSRDRLAQRASSRERPVMTRAASRDKLTERLASNRSASRERVGGRRSESRERTGRATSRDRGSRDRGGQRRGGGHDRLRSLYDGPNPCPAAQSEGAEGESSQRTKDAATSATTEGSELRGVSSSVRSSRSTAGKDKGTTRRSNSRGRGRPDRSSGGTSDGGVDRRRDTSRERRPRRSRPENANVISAADSKHSLSPDSGQLPPPSPSKAGESLPGLSYSAVDRCGRPVEQPPPNENDEAASDPCKQFNTKPEEKENEEEETDVKQKDQGADLLNMIPYEGSSGNPPEIEESTSRQRPGVIFHSQKPQDGEPEQEELDEAKVDGPDVNPALALLGLLAQRDTPEPEVKKANTPPTSNSPDVEGTKSTGNGTCHDAEKSVVSSGTDHSDDRLSQQVTSEEKEDGESGISLSNVKVSISVESEHWKTELKDSGRDTDPVAALLSHIGSSPIVNDKNEDGSAIESAAIPVELPQDDKKEGTPADCSMVISQSSRPSMRIHELGVDKVNEISKSAVGSRRVVRRTKPGNNTGTGLHPPSLPPPSMADPNERMARRVKRPIKKDGNKDFPPPSLPPPSSAGDIPRSNEKKFRRRKAKSYDGEEKALATSSHSMGNVAAGGKVRKVRRAKSDSGADLFSPNELAPPSLAGDFQAAKAKKKTTALKDNMTPDEGPEKYTKLSRRQEKKATRFNKLDDDDGDSLGGGTPCSNQQAAAPRKPRRGMLTKAKSAALVLEKGARIGKKASSSRNVLG